MKRILLTGGFGYIGSHTASVLASENKDFIIYDNFSNSKFSVLERLEKTINKKIVYVNADILESICIEDFKKTLEILIQDRTIVGFDIHNVIMSDAFKLCEALATSLLISQGRISKDRYLRTPSTELPEKPSGLLPVQNLTL